MSNLEYRIIHEDNWQEFCNVVNRAIGDGWTPLGGVSFHRLEREHSDGCLVFYVDYVQAMTRQNPEEVKSNDR